MAVTCAIRENAERKVWQRLDYFKKLKRRRQQQRDGSPAVQVAVLGCMAGWLVRIRRTY